MAPFPLIPGVVSLTASWLASALDLGSFRVPNWLTLPLIASGFLYHCLTGVTAISNGMLGLLFMAFIFVPLWLRGGFGAGDVKLALGMGIWLGVPWTIYAFVGTGLFAGVYSLIHLLLGRAVDWSVLSSGCSAGQTVVEMTKSPQRNSRLAAFAPFMAGGLTAALIWSLAFRGF